MLLDQLKNDNSLKFNVIRGIIWSLLGTFISKGFLLISFIIVARILPIDEYGNLGVLRSTITTFSVVSVVSFGVTVNKYLAKYISTEKERAQAILSMSRVFVYAIAFLISILIYIYSNYISNSIVGDNSLNLAVEISSATIFFTSVNGLQNGILSGLEKFKYISIISVSNGMLSLPVILLLSYYYGYIGTIIGLLIVQFFLWLISFYYTTKSIKESGLSLKLTGFSSELNVVKEFTMPALISGMILPPVILLSDIIITNTPDGSSKLGIYSAAFNFSIITVTLNTVIGQVLYPYIMKEENKYSQKLEFVNQILPFFISVSLNVPLIIFANYIGAIFGESYQNNEFSLSISLIAVSSIVMGHRQGIARKFASQNKLWWSLLGNSFWALIALFTVYHLKDYGSVGRAFGFTLAYVINTLIFIPLYIKMNLISRDLLMNKFSISIWLLILLSFVFGMYISNIYTLMLSSIILPVIFYMFYRWFQTVQKGW